MYNVVTVSGLLIPFVIGCVIRFIASKIFGSGWFISLIFAIISVVLVAAAVFALPVPIIKTMPTGFLTAASIALTAGSVITGIITRLTGNY